MGTELINDVLMIRFVEIFFEILRFWGRRRFGFVKMPALTCQGGETLDYLNCDYYEVIFPDARF